MAEPILWATLAIASSSLVFAFIAFRQVMKTSGSVDGFIERADKLLNNFSTKAKNVFSPKFFGDTISHMLTKDLENKDGSPVNMHQYFQITMNDQINKHGPALKAEIKAMAPELVRVALNPNTSPQGPQTAGQALANQRWGGQGGLQAAQKLGKVSKKLPVGAKSHEYVGYVAAGGEAVPILKEIKEDMFGKKGDNGEQNAAGGGGDAPPAATDWGPPF